jgi:hypothetical protein
MMAATGDGDGVSERVPSTPAPPEIAGAPPSQDPPRRYSYRRGFRNLVAVSAACAYERHPAPLTPTPASSAGRWTHGAGGVDVVRVVR